MEFNDCLRTYAELLVRHGLNVQPGQVVNISAEVCHRDFVNLIVETAYANGARYVAIDLIEPRATRTRVTRSPDADLQFVPRFLPVKYDELVETAGANLRLIGSENPDIFADLDAVRMNKLLYAQRVALRRFYDDGIGKAAVHWTVAAAATERWGEKVLQGVTGQAAERKLWETIFAICRADTADCLDRWEKHNRSLQQRARQFTELGIRELVFSGPGTDLRVTLSPKALFKGGGDLSPRGVEFEPNIPTEEVFTTPDWRGTTGRVTTTRPFFINGKLIRGLTVEFAQGEIVGFDATDGRDTFAAYIESDPGAKRLGEVALVGIDSPVYQTGLVFNEILFDENAACHIAIGSAYKFCIKGGAGLSAADLAAVGCNESNVHTDMMISSEQVDVDAVPYSGQPLPLIRKGRWVV